jgi:hypothetical protein
VNQKLQANNYLIINLVFIGIIVSIIVYSFVFSAEGRQHPVPSGTQQLTGRSSPSTGLSRSFSEIVRFEFRKAREYNPYGIRIFSFFILQLLLRMTGTLLVLSTDQKNLRALIYADAVISVSLFVLCFWPFIVFLARELIH